MLRKLLLLGCVMLAGCSVDHITGGSTLDGCAWSGWFGCGHSGSSDAGGSGVPTVLVSASTSGVDLDPDGYSVTIRWYADSTEASLINESEDRLATQNSDGHTYAVPDSANRVSILLGDIAANCTAQVNPIEISPLHNTYQTVHISKVFDVTCAAM